MAVMAAMGVVEAPEPYIAMAEMAAMVVMEHKAATGAMGAF
jgi:hypothetical protein